MGNISDVQRFLFDANSVFTDKNLSARKMDFKKTIKELTDPQRKKLLEIIQNPAIAEDNDIIDLATAIRATQASLKDGSFQTRREGGLWKRICRICSNIFCGRTRSSDVVKTIKKLESTPLSSGNLSKLNKNLTKLYSDPEELNATDVNGLLMFQQNITLKNNPKNTKAYSDQVFNYDGDVAIDPEIQFQDSSLELNGTKFSASFALDNRDKIQTDNSKYLENGTIGHSFAIFNGCRGEAANNYLYDHLLEEVHLTLDPVKDDLSDANIYNALNRAFNACNRNWLLSYDRLASEKEALSGSSACVALIINDALWIANVGSSRAILIDNMRVQSLSVDAIASAETGEAWDEPSQSWVAATGVHLVQSFGCFNFKDVTATPQITKVSLNDVAAGSKVILGSNGLFDIATSEEVGTYVRSCDPAVSISGKLTNRVVNGYAKDGDIAPSSSVIAISLKI